MLLSNWLRFLTRQQASKTNRTPWWTRRRITRRRSSSRIPERAHVIPRLTEAWVTEALEDRTLLTSVAVFDNGSFVDTAGGAYSESDAVQASLASLGHSVSTFTDFDFETRTAGRDVLLIPELERGDLAAALQLDAAATAAIRTFVSGGGGLVIHGSSPYGVRVLNHVFGFGLSAQFVSGTSSKTPSASGTEFSDDPTSVPSLSATFGIKSGLPAGSSSIYYDAGQNVSTVALIPVGTGQVAYVGWDWFNAKPLGSQDSGWLQVLDSAVKEVGTPTNSPPSDITLSSSEIAENETTVGTLSGTDPDGNALTFSLVSGPGSNDNAAFQISGNSLQIKPTTTLDFEVKSTYSIRVQASDGSSTRQESFSINVTNVEPAISNQTFSVLESAPNATSVGTVPLDSGSDQNNVFFAISGGNTGDAFAIDKSTGVITVRDTTGIDFENATSFSLTVKAIDGTGPGDTATITINVTDAEPAISGQTLSVAENSVLGTLVGTVALDAIPADQNSPTFSIVGGNTGDAFFIEASTGKISVKDATLLDFETTPPFLLSVRTTDGTGPGNTATVTVELIDVPEIVIVNGTPDDDDVTIRRNGNNIEFLSGQGTQIAPSHALNSVLHVELFGQAGDDTLTIDLTGGDFEVPIIVDGGTHTDGDRLIVRDGGGDDHYDLFDNLLILGGLFPVVVYDAEMLEILAGGGNDTLTVDYSFPPVTPESALPITFDGQTGNDSLNLVGGQFDTVTHDLTGPGAGSVDVGEGSSITYTGLEPVDMRTSTVKKLIVDLPAGVTDAFLSDFGTAGDNLSQIYSASAAFESIIFQNPTESLQLRGKDGSQEVVHVLNLDSSFTADIVVDQSTLQLDGNIHSNLFINETATLTGTGSTSKSLNSQGVIDLGNSGGQLTIGGDLTFTSSGELVADLNDPTPGQGFDQLVVGGRVSLAGSLDVGYEAAPSLGSSFRLIDNQGSQPVQGTFANLPEGLEFQAIVFDPLGTATSALTYEGGTGNDVTIFTPDPDAFTLTVHSASFNEGSTNLNTPVTLTAKLSNPLAENLEVEYSLTNGDLEADDFKANQHSSFVIPAGQDSYKFTVGNIIGDIDDESDESFDVNILVDAANGLQNNSSVEFVGGNPTVTILNDDVPLAAPVASIRADVPRVLEGGAGEVTRVPITVELLGAQDGGVVRVEIINGTTEPDDHQGFGSLGIQRDVTFASGLTQQTIFVEVIGDIDPEDDEFLSVRLLGGTDGQDRAIEVPNPNATVFIINDDIEATELNVSDAQIEEGDDHAQRQLSFIITRSGPLDRTTVVNYSTTTSGSATPDVDFKEITSGSDTFLAGETQKTVSVIVLGDSDPEDNETVHFQIDSSDADVGKGLGVGTVLNDDTLVNFVSIHGTSVLEGEAGAKQTVPILIRLSQPAVEDVTVSYSTADDTAKAGEDDYEQTSGTVTFVAGQVQKEIFVVVNGDLGVEDNERFFVNITEDSDAVTLDVDQAQVIIHNDDTDRLTLSVGNAMVLEGGTNQESQLVFTISLSRASIGPIAANYSTADGTAKLNDGDYEQLSGTVTFAAGEISKTVSVLVHGDTTPEGDNTVLLNVALNPEPTPPEPVAVIDGQGHGVIKNDDFSVRTVSIEDVQVFEGAENQQTLVQVPLHLTSPAGTTDPPVDVTLRFIGLDGATRDETVTFASGETTTSFDFTIIGNVTPEADKFAFVTIVSVDVTELDPQDPDDPSRIRTDIIRNQAEVTVLDDDFLVNQLFVDDATLDEGGPGATPRMLFTIRLSRPAEEFTRVIYTTNPGTASDNNNENGKWDYFPKDKDGEFLDFQPGDQLKTVAVKLSGDDVPEAAETFFLDILDVVGASGASSNVEISRGQGTGTILNDDVDELVLSLGDARITEGTFGEFRTLTFNLDLTARTDEKFSVTLKTVEDSATQGVDFGSILNQPIVFDIGDQHKTVSVQIIGDDDDESNESFFLEIDKVLDVDNVEFDRVIVADGQGIGTIVDDDVRVPTITISDAIIQREGGATQQGLVLDREDSFYVFTVTLDGPAEHNIAVDISTADGTATSVLDPTDPQHRDFYRIGTQTILFEKGDVSLQFVVRGLGDNVIEADEFFFVNLDNARYVDDANNTITEDDLGNPLAVTIGRPQGRGTIINDDFPTPLVTIDDVSQLEGNGQVSTFEFTVRLDRPSDTPITVTYKTVDGTATAGDSAEDGDYLPVTLEEVKFAAGETEQIIRVDVFGELDDEPDETFFVNLLEVTSNNAILDDDQGAATIFNDDDPEAVVSVQSVTKSEGQDGASTNFTFTIQLVGNPGEDVIVEYNFDHLTTDDADFDLDHEDNTVEVSHTFQAGTSETTHEVTIVVAGDTDIETDEEFTFNILATGASLGNAQAIGTVVNDDGFLSNGTGKSITAEITQLKAELEAEGLSDQAIISQLSAKAVELFLAEGLVGDFFIGVFDPVDFVVTDADGRQAGFTENTGVVQDAPKAFLSGNGAVELLIVPSAGSQVNVELVGVGSGDFRVGFSQVSANGSVTTRSQSGTITGGNLALAVDFTATSPSAPATVATAVFPIFDVSSIGGSVAADGTQTTTAQSQNALAFSAEAASAAKSLLGSDVEVTRRTFTYSQVRRLFDNFDAHRTVIIDAVRNSIELPLLEDLLPGDDELAENEADSAMNELFWSGLSRSLLGLPTEVFQLGKFLGNLLPRPEGEAESEAKPADDDQAEAPDDRDNKKQKVADLPELKADLADAKQAQPVEAKNVNQTKAAPVATTDQPVSDEATPSVVPNDEPTNE